MVKVLYCEKCGKKIRTNRSGPRKYCGDCKTSEVISFGVNKKQYGMIKKLAKNEGLSVSHISKDIVLNYFKNI